MKILIIRFSSIGDIVLCTPVIRACKNQLKAEVHLLTKNRYRSVIANNPNIDKIHSFENHLSELKAALKAENYDHIIDLHRNLRSRLVKWWLDAPSSTFPKENFNKWLLVNTKVNRMPSAHIVDRYFLAFDQIKNDGKGLDYKVRNESQVDLGIGKYIVIVLGATYYTKRIPQEVVQEIISKVNFNVVLVGGPEEKNLGERLAGEFDLVLNTCGQYNLDQSASIVQQSELVVTSDTGMMHIASALKKTIIMLWGNTLPAFGMGPYQTSVSHYEVEGLKCRPCSKLGKKQCPKGHFKCMLDQDITRLSEEVLSIIGDV